MIVSLQSTPQKNQTFQIKQTPHCHCRSSAILLFYFFLSSPVFKLIISIITVMRVTQWLLQFWTVAKTQLKHNVSLCLRNDGLRDFTLRTGGEWKEVLSSELEDIIWFPQKQKLHKVRCQCPNLRMTSQIRSMVCLYLILPQGKTKTGKSSSSSSS